MKIKINSCYKGGNKVVAIARSNYYVYPKHLNNAEIKELIGKVLEAGEIETDRWHLGEQT